jgi:hypothetical protein
MPARPCRTSRHRLSALSVRPVHSLRSLRALAHAALVAAFIVAPAAVAQGAAPPPAVSTPTAATPAADAPKSEERLAFDSAAWDAPEPWRTDRWYFQTAYYTWHFHYDANHKQSVTGDLTYRTDKYWLGGQVIGGFALFTNSFGQFSQYAYGALQWRPVEEYPAGYVKVSAGLVHGYSGEYKDKIPFNDYGVAPVIIPSVGYCWNRYCGEFILLGFNAMQFTVGVTLP